MAQPLRLNVDALRLGRAMQLIGLAVLTAIGTVAIGRGPDLVGTVVAAESGPEQALRRAQDDLTEGEARQRRLDQKARALGLELAELRLRLVAAADAAAAQDAELAALESSLAGLATEERDQHRKLDSERQRVADLLGALVRLSRTPPEVMIARPEAPGDIVHTAILLRAVLPVLRQRADALATALEHLKDLRTRLADQRRRAAAARAALGERQIEIGRLVQRRELLSRETAAEREEVAQRMARLAAQVTDLRQLLERLETERQMREAAARQAALRQPSPAPPSAPEVPEAPETVAAPTADRAAVPPVEMASVSPPAPPATELAEPATLVPPQPGRNGLRLPVNGPVLVGYGDRDRFGAASRGLHIQVRSGAPVVAPLDGVIRFAGSFRNYGRLLIVEHGNGYHSLIAGLGRIDGTVGQPVSAGEPVGLTAEPTDGAAELYFELRRNGQPVNPRQGFGAPEAKGQG